MTTPRTVDADDASCPCVADHNPNPHELHEHHIVPKAWGGPDTPENLVVVCPTTHANVHRLLREYVKAGCTPPLDVRRRYSASTRYWAEQGWMRKARYGATPTLDETP